MSDAEKPCVRCRLWRWWTGERTPRHRLVAYVVVVLVAFGGLWRVETTNAATQATAERTKVIQAANNFTQCQALNAGALATETTNLATDQMLVLAGQLGAGQRTPEQQAQVDASMRTLRQPLADARSKLVVLDCAVLLRGLTSTQRQQVTDTTVPPTIPR